MEDDIKKKKKSFILTFKEKDEFALSKWVFSL